MASQTGYLGGMRINTLVVAVTTVLAVAALMIAGAILACFFLALLHQRPELGRP